MEGKGEGLAALFNEHLSEIAEPEGKTKVAIMLVQDSDGDFGIVKVEEGRKPRVLGWLVDADAAREFGRMADMLGSGQADSFETSEDILEEALNGL